MTKFTFTLIAVIALSTTVAFGGEWIIFSDELPPGADLAVHGNSQFVVSNSNPYQGANHLKRDFATWGDWGWITGVMSLNLDLSSIDFDTAYIEFYIDGGTNAIGYLELRLGGAAWDPDFQNTGVTVDDQPGYELVKVMLKDFTGTGGGASPTNLDEFTGGTGMIDRISWGFGAAGDLFVDEVRILDAEGGEQYSYALSPVPEDGTLYLDTWVSLGWRAGDSAVSHDVYIGDSLDEVNDGVPGAPGFQGNQAETSLLLGFPGFAFPDGLVPGATYYWRIDEVNDADPNSPWRGDVWSFSIPPKTAYAPDPADGAEFVDPDANLRWTGGYGAKLHTIHFGDTFEDVNIATGGAMSGTATYRPPSPFDVEKVIYWRVDEFDGIDTHKGDIWAFTTPDAVGSPQPANSAVDVSMIAPLSWTPADNASSSDLYFGTDRDAVKNATTTSPEYFGNKALGSESHDPGKLALDASYYWRADAVYPTGTVKGLVWTFTTADFILIDDFESYNDIDPPDPASNRIFDKWIDGFGTTTNGALVGNDLPPYAEQTIVHGGAQSMPYAYDNNLKTSEATLTLVYPRDWTEEGVTKLSLWFRGDSGNAAERMFVALGNAVVYHDDASATQITGWNQWVIDLTEFAGVDLANVNTIAIGFGTKDSPVAGDTGTMYFDDIRLVR
jgi:hypothetical protein